MKYKTIGAFKNVQNIPYCKAIEDMKVGMGVVLDRAAKTASWQRMIPLQRLLFTLSPTSMISLSFTTALRLMW